MEDPTPQPQSDAVTPDVTDMPSTTPNCSPQIVYGHYYKGKKQIHSVNAFPSTYLMEKHQT